MSNEYRTVYGEASLHNGITATLLAGHVVVFSDRSCTPAKHLGIARWLDGRVVQLHRTTRVPDSWDLMPDAQEDLSPQVLVALSVRLCKAIPQPWVVYKAKSTKSGLVRLHGLNLWTAGEFYWTVDGSSFEANKYQTHLYDWTQATIDPEARTTLLAWGVTLP